MTETARAAPPSSLLPGGGVAALLALGLVLTALVLSPVLRAGFVNWDDDAYVLENPLVQSLDAASVRAIFLTTFEGNYHPLTLLSYAIERALFGAGPFPGHFTNYALHLLNTALVFFLTQALFDSPRAALVCALAFGLHPMRIETVAWVSERKGVLSAFFTLGSLLCYVARTRRGGGQAALTCTFALFLLASLSKPMALTLPLVLFLVDRHFGVRLSRRTLAEKVPFLLVAAILAIVTLRAQQGVGAVSEAGAFYGWRYPLVVLNSAWFYISRFLVPVGLSAFYPYPPVSQVTSPAYLLGAALGTAALLFPAACSRWLKECQLGGWFYLLMILPVLKIIPIGNVPVADRYFYLPGLGLLWVAVALFESPGRGRPALAIARAAGALLLAAWIGLLGYQAWKRTQVWQDSASLWGEVAARYPADFLAQFNLGRGLLEKGDLTGALEHFSAAIAIKPFLVVGGRNVRDPYFHCYRGLAFKGLGRRVEAERDFLVALEGLPDYRIALIELGNLALEAGDRQRADDYFRKAGR